MTAGVETSAHRAPRDCSIPAQGSGLGYRPGLDGLRGLAVAAVLCFHGDFRWAQGGFLGVSTFFTLSGFLITTLALDEIASSGRISLRAFWRRRFRRLLPASIVALGLAVVVTVAVGDHPQRTNLPGDVLGALTYVANWRFLLSEQSYADLFAAPSPVLHFWSLAIEEQFYVLFPLLMAGLVWFVGRRPTSGRRPTEDRRFPGVVGIAAATFAVLAALSVGVTLLAGFDQQRIYLGTDTRGFEILMGALLATGAHSAVRRGWLDQRGPAQRLVTGVGCLVLAGAVVAWITVPQSTHGLYRGGLAAYAAGSAVLVVAVSLGRGALARVVGVRPLVRLGRISYGVYLYHWPIFIWLRQATDLGDGPRFVIGATLALVAAEVSSRVIEGPVRHGGRLFGRPAWRLAPAVVPVIVVGAFLVSSSASAPLIDFQAAQRELTAPVPPPTTVAPTAPTAPLIPRVAFFGDSTAAMTGKGLADWFASNGRATVSPSGVSVGCSLMGGEQVRRGDRVEAGPDGCPAWPEEWEAIVASGRPDVAVVQIGSWDIQDRRVGPDGRWRAPGDPIYDEELLNRMLGAVDLLSSEGALVVWLLTPESAPGRAGTRPDPVVDAQLPRMNLVNDLARRLPALRPGRVTTIDLAGWLTASPDEARLRPDGTHFTEATAFEVADLFLGPRILAVAR